MPNPPPARANVEAALRAQATRTAVDQIKERARAYAKRPMTSENVFPGLSAAAPETIIAVAKHLIAAERNAPRRGCPMASKLVYYAACFSKEFPFSCVKLCKGD
jgi:hypothetical protein